jgi:hypothetical protein
MHISRSATIPNQSSFVRRTNSHRSVTSTEHSNATHHRRQINRTHSNASQLPTQQQQQTPQRPHRQQHRVANVADQSPSLTNRPPPFERRSSRQTQNVVTPRQQRPKKTS